MNEDSLTEAVRTLTEQVEGLRRRLRTSQTQLRRTRLLTWVVAVIAAGAAAMAVATGALWLEVRETADQNQDNAIQACRNSNDARAANQQLWEWVLSVSSARPNISEEQVLRIERMRTWITQLYAPRDCSDLTKVYRIPKPPPISDNERDR